MRVMSYNIRGGLGMDGRRDINRIGRVVVDLRPDIVCLQEVHQRLPWSGWGDQPRRLGRHLGMAFTFQPNLKLMWGGYGLGVASPYSMAMVRRHRLPGRGEPRGVLEVVLETPAGLLAVFCTHWGLSEEERLAQAERTREWVGQASMPAILCGDLNERATGGNARGLLAGAGLRDAGADVDTPTYPADAPRARIDVIFHSPALRMTSFIVGDSLASDHLPLVAEFTSG